MEKLENNIQHNNQNDIENPIRNPDFLAPTPTIAEQYNHEGRNSEYMRGVPSSSYIDNFKHSSNLYGGGISSMLMNPYSPIVSSSRHILNNSGLNESYMATSPRYFANPYFETPNNESMKMPSKSNLDQSGIKKIDNLNNSNFTPLVNSSDNTLGSNTFQNTSKNTENKTEDQTQSQITRINEIPTKLEYPKEALPEIQNIVSTANLKCSLDLRKIALSARNAEYNPKRFAAVIMRIKEPKTTALIFTSGKMVCTGARSEQDSKKAARKYAKNILHLGFDVKFSGFTIQNIVGSCDVKFQISLEGLSLNHNCAHYEPEVFPGLIFRMIKPKIVLLIFVSGKIVLTGAKKKEEIYQAFENIYPTLVKYKSNFNRNTNSS